MMDKQHINLITAYLDGSITSEQRRRFNELIDQGEIDVLDIKNMEKTYQQLGDLPSAEPSEKMRDSFYTMLKDEKEQQTAEQTHRISNWINNLITPNKLQRFALITGVLLIGMLAGNLFTPFHDYRQQINQLSDEVSQMREVMMLSLLDARSPSERLKAVNISTDISSSDDRIVSALLKTLNNDSNVNVRLASIEALLRHADNPAAREGLVEAISKQQSPQVQVALADAMLALQEKESIEELQQLLEENDLNSNVRDKLKNTIAALEKKEYSNGLF